MELDHAFVVCRPEPSSDDLASASAELAERAARAMRAAGFVEGESRSHPGQGTANRRFFFERFMFEFLFVDDEPALGSASTQRFGLRERFVACDASPFGVAWRPSASGDAPEFDHDVVSPSYLPDGLCIDVARASGTAQPLLFHLPFLPPFDGEHAGASHPNGAYRLGGLSVSHAEPDAQGAWALLEACGHLEVRAESPSRLSLLFATRAGGDARTVELPAELPLEITLV